MIPFEFRGVEVRLDGVRRDAPPMMQSVDYELIIDPDENAAGLSFYTPV